MKNKPKVVVDTNIFIKGWFFDDISSTITIMDLIDKRKIQLLFSQETIGELVYVMKNFVRHNIEDKNEQVEMLKDLMILFYYGTSVNTSEVNVVPLNDKYDEMFLKCAIKGCADYLVSNDFRSGLHQFEDIRVLSSDEFIKTYENVG